jgi:molybdopterin converting factor small subunit
MVVRVKLYYYLKKLHEKSDKNGVDLNNVEISEGGNIGELITSLGIKTAEVGFSNVNGFLYNDNSIILRDGDVVSLYPLLSGG